jgi:hypothetical protein
MSKKKYGAASLRKIQLATKAQTSLTADRGTDPPAGVQGSKNASHFSFVSSRLCGHNIFCKKIY